MKKVTLYISDDKLSALLRLAESLDISLLEEDEELKVEEWQRDTVATDDTTNDYLTSEDIEKTVFSREK
jgi:hypothetical protein